MSKNVPSNHEPPISPADWDAIVAAAFSPDAEPHVFSDRYQKQKQKQEEFLMPKKSIRGRKTIVIAAILAAAVVAIPTSAYAVNRIYQASMQSTGSYQKEVVIDAGDSTLDTRTQSLQVGWMPDGMTLDKSSGKYHDDQNRGVSMLFWKMQDGDFLQTVNRGILKPKPSTAIRSFSCNGLPQIFQTDRWTTATLSGSLSRIHPMQHSSMQQPTSRKKS